MVHSRSAVTLRTLSPTPAPPPPPPPLSRRPRPRRSIGFLEGAIWFLVGMAGGAAIILCLVVAWFLLVSAPRTNILLLGVDRRPGESGPSRTDTMILTSVYPRGPSVAMLSIPRDLWVTLPDGSENRINTAYHFAELEEPGSGPTAAMSTVRANFGVSVHRYVLIDFEGFVRLVDAAGGIKIDVPERLVDFEFPTDDFGVTTVTIEAGPQQMDGLTSLAYARIRHGSSDFKRAERQQLVIEAFVAQLLRPATILRYPAIIAATAGSVGSDISPLLALRLAPTLLRVGPSGIERRVIQDEMVQPYITSDGASVQLPVWEAINPALLELFGE